MNFFVFLKNEKQFSERNIKSKYLRFFKLVLIFAKSDNDFKFEKSEGIFYKKIKGMHFLFFKKIAIGINILK